MFSNTTFPPDIIAALNALPTPQTMNNVDKVLAITSTVYEAGKELRNISASIGIDEPEFAKTLVASLEDLISANTRILNHLKEVLT